MDVVESNDGSTSIGLADGNLEHEGRNGNEEDGQEVGDEPLQAIVIVYN